MAFGQGMLRRIVEFLPSYSVVRLAEGQHHRSLGILLENPQDPVRILHNWPKAILTGANQS